MEQAPRSTDKANYATPAGRLVLKADAPRDAWLEARKTGLGASDASKILGLSNYGDQFTVWAEKRGLTKEIEDNEAMYWGRALEPALINRFTEDTGIPVRRSGLLRSREQAEILYTPDGLSADGGIVEAKTFGQWLESDWVGPEGEHLVPDHAYCQVQQGIFVTGRSHAYIIGLGSGRNWYIRRVERDEELIALIREQAAKLWQHVMDGTEPPVGKADFDVIRQLHPVGENDREIDSGEDSETAEQAQALRLEYKLAADREKAAKTDKDGAKAKIAQITGDSERVLVDGSNVWTYKNSGKFMPSTFAKIADEDTVAECSTHKVVIPIKNIEAAELLVATLEQTFTELAPAVVTEVDGKVAAEVAPDLYKASRARVLLVAK